MIAARSATRRFNNVILDLDGTIVDSRRDIADAQLWALAQVGVDSLRREDLYRYIGRPLEYTFEQLLPVTLHDRIPDVARMYSEYFPSHSLLTTTLFPGVKDTLRQLHREGVHLAIASSKKGGGIKRVTDHFGIYDLFAQLQGSDRLRFKPAPDVINIILAAQGWKAHDTLMVGDTDVDILAGKNAGVSTAAVTYGSLPEEELVTFDPDYILRSFPDLLPLVKGEAHTQGERNK